MKNYILLTFILFIFSFFPNTILAKVYINEIFPNPSPATTTHEWVELYNDATIEANLSGYKLKDAANNTIILSQTLIPSKGFIVATSSGILNNSGDTINLSNSSGDLIDTITYPSISANQSYVRCADGGNNWFTSILQTLGSSNNPICNTLTPSISPTPTGTISPTTAQLPSNTPTPILFPTTSIFISEVMVNPLPEEQEWVELYNDNETGVTLNNWYIDDVAEGGASPKTFTLVIPSKGYGVVELSTGIFNNDGDDIRLLDANKNEIEKITYTESEEGISFGKEDIYSLEACWQNPSKGKENNECLEPTTIPSPTSSLLPIITKKPTPTKSPTPIKAPKPTSSKKISEPQAIVVGKTEQSNRDKGSKDKKLSAIDSTVNKTPHTQHTTKHTQNDSLVESSQNKMAVKSILVASTSYAFLALSSILIKVRDLLPLYNEKLFLR